MIQPDHDAHALDLADRAVAAAAAAVAADPDRPRCHLLPPGQWMNDPNGTIFHGGWYHVFYQHHPYGDAWGSMHWGHARSPDLIHWQHLPIALAPRPDLGEEHCFSGCIAIGDDGIPRLLYTSVAPGGGAGRASEQWVARGDAGLGRWRRCPDPAVGRNRPGEPTLDHDARDPYVFSAEGRRWLVFGASLGGESVVPIYEAADGSLERWTYRGILHREPGSVTPYPECPNFFPVGDQWLLAVAPYGPVRWTLGGFAAGGFAPERRGLLDLHDQWYASNTLTDEHGRVVLLGWIRGFAGGRGWNGCLAFPRLVEPDARAGIRQLPHPAVEGLRAGEAIAWRGRTEGEALIAADAGDAVELQARLRPTGVAAVIGLDGDGRAAGVELRWDGAQLAVAGSFYPIASRDGWLDLRLFLDRGVLEIFADEGRSVLTRVVARAARGGRCTLRGAEGEARLWRLASCRREAVGS